MLYCNQCGSRAKDTDAYCPHCGCTTFFDVNNPKKKIKRKITKQKRKTNNDAFDNSSLQKIGQNSSKEKEDYQNNADIEDKNDETFKNNTDNYDFRTSDDKFDIALFLVGLCFPIIGLVEFFLMRAESPKKANGSLVGAILNFIVLGVLLTMALLYPDLLPDFIIDYFSEFCLLF